MRWIVNILTVLMVIGLAAFVVREHGAGISILVHRREAREATHRIYQELTLRAALGENSSRGLRYPATIDPRWFGDAPPQNPLLSGGHPWVEVCSGVDRLLEHPPDPLAADKSVAQFWYNPHRGIIRARIPANLTDADALDLYNFINDCAREQLIAATPPRAPGE